LGEEMYASYYKAIHYDELNNANEPEDEEEEEGEDEHALYEGEITGYLDTTADENEELKNSAAEGEE
jgi:hypothetical protein